MVKQAKNIGEFRASTGKGAPKRQKTCADCKHRVVLTETGDSVCEKSGKMIHPLRLEREVCAPGRSRKRG